MSNKNKQAPDMKSIKEYEKAQRSTLKVETEAPKKIGFDQWWADKGLSAKLAPHMKEIVYADFRGRGLTAIHALEAWDTAAKQFGLML